MNLFKELDAKEIELLKKINYEVEDRNLTDYEINDVVEELAKAETSNWDKDRNSTILSTTFNELSLKILECSEWEFEKKLKLKHVLESIQGIEYGWIDEFGTIHKQAKKDYFEKNYKLQTIDETIDNKIGTCWDIVEVLRCGLTDECILNYSYIVIYNDNEKIAKHTIMVVPDKNYLFYWLDNKYGVKNDDFIAFDSAKQILRHVINEFPKWYGIDDFDKSKIEIYKYGEPKPRMTYSEFVEFCRKQEKIEL